jgi:hypothetical protein
MRSVLLICALVLAGIFALSSWRPGEAVSSPTLTPTMFPDDFTLIPAFEPSYPCELQIVDVRDEKLCRSERVTEQVLFEGDGVQFIQHDYHMGQGCWSGISQDIHKLYVCDKTGGERMILTADLTTAPVLSPDGAWLAFGTMNPLSTEGDALLPHVYRVRLDGSGLQQLDTQGFPAGLVGAPMELRWLDDDWVALKLWDAAGNDQSNYHLFRLKTDGSGVYEALTQMEAVQP